jgi:hypothetical protein
MLVGIPQETTNAVGFRLYTHGIYQVPDFVTHWPLLWLMSQFVSGPNLDQSILDLVFEIFKFFF